MSEINLELHPIPVRSLPSDQLNSFYDMIHDIVTRPVNEEIFAARGLAHSVWELQRSPADAREWLGTLTHVQNRASLSLLAFFPTREPAGEQVMGLGSLRTGARLSRQRLPMSLGPLEQTIGGKLGPIICDPPGGTCIEAWVDHDGAFDPIEALCAANRVLRQSVDSQSALGKPTTLDGEMRAIDPEEPTLANMWGAWALEPATAPIEVHKALLGAGFVREGESARYFVNTIRGRRVRQKILYASEPGIAGHVTPAHGLKILGHPNGSFEVDEKAIRSQPTPPRGNDIAS